MKIAIGQINPRVGDVAWNLKLILDQTHKAKGSGCELVAFPELSLLGYPPRDLLDFPQIVDENLRALENIKEASSNICVVVGYVERNSSSTGKPFFNSAAVFYKGKQIANYRKWLLPYYNIFEEERYFESASETVCFKINNKNIALSICEDLWNEQGFVTRLYDKKPIDALSNLKIDLVFNLSASPFELGKNKTREKLFQQVSKKLKAPVIYCNQVGANDELLFDGSSFVMGENGKTAQAKAFEQELLVWDSENSKPQVNAPELTEAQSLLEGLSLGIRDYLDKTPAGSICLGLSGGIDSSVVAAIAVKALGPNRVFGFAMPSKFNAAQSLEDAQKLAQNLGISLRTLPIDRIYEAVKKELEPVVGHSLKTLTLENTQPRIRMTLLMAIANEEGHLLLNTSNKSEILAGYATLYGDTAGALSVLGDLTKHQVYELAKMINANKEVIPRRILERAPSAELRENQADQDTLPPYDILDSLVVGHVEGLKPFTADVWPKIPPETLKKVSHLNSISEYKRRQLPPALRVTSRAFGMGRRIPVVGRKPAE